MRDFIWGFNDLDEGIDDDDLVMLFGPYVGVVKSLVDEKGHVLIEYVKRMPAALAVEEVLRSPTNTGVFFNRARIIGMKGKWDMSQSAPYYNPWNKLDIEED